MARMATAAKAQRELARLADKEVARSARRFFRTEKGGYAEGDRFRGIKVPTLRQVARNYRTLPLVEIRKLLRSPFHEDRMLGLIVLVHQAGRADAERGRQLADFYLHERDGVNNWDLVDLSAPALLGPFVDDLAKRLDTMSRSRDVWERRISILAHFKDIRAGDVDGYLRFIRRFLDDEHDLIHKAAGWMLRECGIKDVEKLRAFLDKHHAAMPRTMLRYAIEKLSATERAKYMART